MVNSIGEVHHSGHRFLVAVVSDDQESMGAGIRQVETAAVRAVDVLLRSR
ncbi:hypothetical protein SSP24_80190 [Streptomyces spinoverrucosus]|uniref:Uncharacterized protein n=1 Tax=Streptomyces spinoverrucosus TaxID=284043 RepID=A0A4Y3VTR3_9ACTN|nr:hypothetical protein SSP24_80190 [Streptomyces spinoverrucosus]GHB98475.1 hypothetical protein GCM10010397_83650 [Streptomyces spinoverrucosus]